MAKCKHIGVRQIEQGSGWIKITCFDCGASVTVGVPRTVKDFADFHAPPKWATWWIIEELFKYRRIAAHVDARTWIAAKEKAGYGVHIRAMEKSGG